MSTIKSRSPKQPEIPHLMQIFYILFVTVFIINAFYFLFLRKLFNLLKNIYPEKFKELGEPSLWWNNSPRNGEL